MKTQRLSGLLAACLPGARHWPWPRRRRLPPAAPSAITAPAQKTIGMPSTRQVLVGADRGERPRRQARGPEAHPRRRVAQRAILFTSRPARGVGHMLTPDMVDIWTTGSFAKDPPNATVSVFQKDGSGVSDVVVVLKSPKLDGDKLTFDVAGARRQPRQRRRSGLGLHRHDLVRPRRLAAASPISARARPPAARRRPSAAARHQRLRQRPGPIRRRRAPLLSPPAVTAAPARRRRRTLDPRYGPTALRRSRLSCPATEPHRRLHAFPSPRRRPARGVDSPRPAGRAGAQTAGAPQSPPLPGKTIGKPQQPQIVPSMIVLNARGAKLAGQKLILEGISPNAIVFADRPIRSAGHALTDAPARGVEQRRARQLRQGPAQRHGVGAQQGQGRGGRRRRSC